MKGIRQECLEVDEDAEGGYSNKVEAGRPPFFITIEKLVLMLLENRSLLKSSCLDRLTHYFKSVNATS